MKRHAPSVARNCEPIGEVLAQELPQAGLVLEVASGTGEHAVAYAGRFPALLWQPTDGDAEALASIAAWREEADLPNLLPPQSLNASAAEWPVIQCDAMLCINMVHISPVEASEGLFAGAFRALPVEGPLILYGPYVETDVPTAPSNIAFDADLRQRDPRWGLRHVHWMDDLAARHGFARTRRAAMPANNLILIYRKC